MNSVAQPPLEVVRCIAAGSIDDGKSTLIGRLLYESGSVLDDQLRHVLRARRHHAESCLELALLTDGLRSEREQGITIDVAYRYFTAGRRRLILADAPGHVQYTRNMITAASTADIGLLLVDVTKGPTIQSRRHAFLMALLGVSRLIVAVNKMDLVDYRREHYDQVVRAFTDMVAELTLSGLTILPVSALSGDNVVRRSSRLAWYDGGPLVHHLETVPVQRHATDAGLRLPVQYVVRTNGGRRGYAGHVVSGSLRTNDEVLVLPSGRTTRVRAIDRIGTTVIEASAGQAVVLTTEEDLDISRGDVLVAPATPPETSCELDADLCWMDPSTLVVDRPYILRHGTRELQAVVQRINSVIDMDTLSPQPAETLGLNDIGQARLRTAQPLTFDPYSINKAMGSFVLIDAYSNRTVAGGMLRSSRQLTSDGNGHSPATAAAIPPDRHAWEQRNGHRAAVVWFTGLPAAGKTTLARSLERRLFERGCAVVVLDGDDLRDGLSRDLGFSREDRAENLRRATEVARLLFEHGHLVLCAFVSPFRADRLRARQSFPEGRFIEVMVRASLETCMRRDPKQLYARGRDGVVPNVTGLNAPYEEPESPELILENEERPADAAVDLLLETLTRRGLI